MNKYLKRVRFIFRFKRFLPFLYEFFGSKELAISKKITGVLLIFTYVLFPFDLIPDYLLFFGVIDDFVIATLVLERMIKMAPESLKDKYKVLD